eukprot:GHVT01028039.1.p1 GENE.GHVT01028039.1~~GHVT01028039.1.p1  ORF type:complete len:498 (+),score=76.25 GHVT01028039.1:494-1987(+)
MVSPSENDVNLTTSSSTSVTSSLCGTAAAPPSSSFSARQASSTSEELSCDSAGSSSASGGVQPPEVGSASSASQSPVENQPYPPLVSLESFSVSRAAPPGGFGSFMTVRPSAPIDSSLSVFSASSPPRWSALTPSSSSSVVRSPITSVPPNAGVYPSSSKAYSVTRRPESENSSSVPAAPSASSPPPSSHGGFVLPFKRIHSETDVVRFAASPVFREILETLTAWGAAVRGVITPEVLKSADIPADTCSHVVRNIVHLLDTIDMWIDDFPPVDQILRFGNIAFRNWWDRLEERGLGLLTDLLPVELGEAVVELLPYLLDSFGNRTRIDFGTGHELAFFSFLLCLWKLGAVQQSDVPDLVLRVFNRYLYLMRKLQTTYMLEPAGSRGVWGLDDYHFLPFLWGAAQLTMQDEIKPEQAVDAMVVTTYADQYLYLNAIKFIMDTKKGALFAECAPMLWDISAVASWRRVHNGLLKMFEGEILRKFPIVQHFMFGSILKWE